jgi:hypothetical protein
LFDDEAVRCWGTNRGGRLGDMGANLPAVNVGTGARVRRVAASHDHTCALLVDGHVKCWGANQNGQLGVTVAFVGDRRGSMGDALPAIDLGTGRRARSIAIGSDHACAALDDGSVKCWGGSNAAALGLGGIVWPDRRLQDMGDALPAVNLGSGAKALAVTVGTAHSCALLEGGAVKCWGVNGSGQLGLGDTRPRGARPGEMGSALPVVDLGD